MAIRKIAALGSVLLLCACASVIEGRSQEFAVKTEPAGAKCAVSRNDFLIGTVSETPGSVYIEKTKDALSVSCSKNGYVTTTAKVDSTYPENNWLYILVGGPVGWGIDSATGADNLYQSPFLLKLQRETAQ